MSLAPPRSLHFKIHLCCGVSLNPVECPRVSHVWERQPDNWVEGRQRPRRTALNDCYKWLNCLLTVLPLTWKGGHPHPFSALLLSFFFILTNHFSMCFPTCCYAGSLIINFIPEFTVSASMVKPFFTGGKDPGKNNFWSLALAGLVARIPGSHPGFPGSIPGKGIALHVTAHCQVNHFIKWHTNHGPWPNMKDQKNVKRRRHPTNSEKLIAYSWMVVAGPQEDAGILGLWKRRIQSGARDEAWSPRAFVQ